MIKWRVITGSGVKAKRTFTEFRTRLEAEEMARGRPIVEIETRWLVKMRDKKVKGAVILGDYGDLKEAYAKHGRSESVRAFRYDIEKHNDTNT